jgi:hypothetical protein
MKTMILSTITAAAMLAGVSAQASPTNSYQQNQSLSGASFVRVSHEGGYYIVAPGSDAVDTLGVQDAPVSDSSASHTGVGSDALAFRFGADGALASEPVYINQARPDSFYTRRLAGLTTHRTTLADVRAMFPGHAIRVEKQGTQTLAYLEVPVFDPLASGD